MSANSDYPILAGDDAKDERSPGVVLLTTSADTKETAEDCGLWWYLREWELHDLNGQTFWFSRSGFSIQKAHIKALARIP